VYWSGFPRTTQPRIYKNQFQEILSVGTCSPRKGTHRLIEAFMMGIKEGQIQENVILTIIGFDNVDYRFVGDLILQTIHSGLKNRIRFVRSLSPDQLDAYYEKADLYVLCSTQECLPLALLQAMSKGLPIVTTGVNGCVEAIEHQKNGLICPPWNSRLLMEAIVEMLSKPEKSKLMGQNARETFNEKFCLEKNMETMNKCLNEAML
jgi:glycosyltransferase involved in cell wall biosynthesis